MLLLQGHILYVQAPESDDVDDCTICVQFSFEESPHDKVTGNVRKKVDISKSPGKLYMRDW